MALAGYFLVFAICFAVATADTPANCTLNDLHGTWHVYIYSGGHNRTLKCENPGQVRTMISLTFSGINTVTMDKIGAKGNFNIIYNQGFEAIINYRKFFAFFAWEPSNASTPIYWCDHTMYGWSHDVLGNDWACINAVKHKPETLSATIDQAFLVKTNKISRKFLREPYSVDQSSIELINTIQKSWIAAEYPDLNKMTYEQVLMRSGYGNGPISTPKAPKKSKFLSNLIVSSLPQSFDWRNVGGLDYVSPIRNQESCGSCYAFASMAMLESRIRIMSNNSQQPVFSPQDVVSCSEYAQGCAGGFPYLIAGKYAQDFGVIDEACYPYLNHDTAKCTPTKPCQRTYVAQYEYIGGYYGASNEENMMQALIANGPIVVGLEVYSDLQSYKSGIYHHLTETEITHFGDFNPFQLTNHAVLIVGYGADAKTGEKFWIVKNSWGKNWGENGYFRIRRGTDEVSIESLAMQSWPIPHIQ